MTVAAFAPYRRTRQPVSVGWWDYFDQQRDLPMAAQVYPWTCSICATTWVLQATGLEPNAAREQVAGEIGYPNCVNPDIGLANTQCLVRVFESYDVGTTQEWVDWERAFELCASTTGVLNSTAWYHFVAIRGVTADGQLWIANSAPGYRGIGQSVSRAQFQAWAGSWQIVWLQP